MRTLRPGWVLSWAVEDLADCLGKAFHRPVDLVSRHSRERYLFVLRTGVCDWLPQGRDHVRCERNAI